MRGRAGEVVPAAVPLTQVHASVAALRLHQTFHQLASLMPRDIGGHGRPKRLDPRDAGNVRRQYDLRV